MKRSGTNVDSSALLGCRVRWPDGRLGTIKNDCANGDPLACNVLFDDGSWALMQYCETCRDRLVQPNDQARL